MEYSLIFAFYLIFIVAIVVISTMWSRSRSNDIIDQWAQTQGFQVVSREERTFFRGPFFWRAGKNQTVYYVQVRDAQGELRTAWLRCGGMWAGLLSDQVEVEWETGQPLA